MPIETTWHIENRVIYQRHHGKLTVADFIRSKDELLAMLNMGIAPVHCIVSLIELESYPSLLEIQKFAQRGEHPASGWTILVINNTALRFIASLIVQLATKQFKTVPTLKEGIRFLMEFDKTLDKDSLLRS